MVDGLFYCLVLSRAATLTRNYFSSTPLLMVYYMFATIALENLMLAAQCSHSARSIRKLFDPIKGEKRQEKWKKNWLFNGIYRWRRYIFIILFWNVIFSPTTPTAWLNIKILPFIQSIHAQKILKCQWLKFPISEKHIEMRGWMNEMRGIREKEEQRHAHTHKHKTILK